jgi:hypothetical protein
MMERDKMAVDEKAKGVMIAFGRAAAELTVD